MTQVVSHNGKKTNPLLWFTTTFLNASFLSSLAIDNNFITSEWSLPAEERDNQLEIRLSSKIKFEIFVLIQYHMMQIHSYYLCQQCIT